MSTKYIGLAATVDELGALNAQIEQLKAQASVLKNFIIDNAPRSAKEVKGGKYKARISRIDGGARIDYSAVAKALRPAVGNAVWDAVVARNKRSRAGYTSVSLYDL